MVGQSSSPLCGACVLSAVVAARFASRHAALRATPKDAGPRRDLHRVGDGPGSGRQRLPLRHLRPAAWRLCGRCNGCRRSRLGGCVRWRASHSHRPSARPKPQGSLIQRSSAAAVLGVKTCSRPKTTGRSQPFLGAKRTLIDGCSWPLADWQNPAGVSLRGVISGPTLQGRHKLPQGPRSRPRPR